MIPFLGVVCTGRAIPAISGYMGILGKRNSGCAPVRFRLSPKSKLVEIDHFTSRAGEKLPE